MIEKVLPDVYRLEIPLPQNPLKAVNSYVIKGEDRNLIIDTGLNRKECKDAFDSGLDELGIKREETDLFITHLHADHFGLVGYLASESSKVYFNRPDSEIIEAKGHWNRMVNYAGQNGFPEEELQNAIRNHPGVKFAGDWMPDLSILSEGDTIQAGDYLFECVETPGHSLGHICLYEREKKILVSGDHILIDITPNIQCWSDSMDSLTNYLESLDKVNALEIDIVLPGHRRLIKDCRQRIKELKEHHKNRLNEVLSILQDDHQTAFDVAAHMTWDINYASWDLFPVSQKWFATGEAIAHLRCLEERGQIKRRKENGTNYFALTNKGHSPV
ncbi:MAG: MBL fold metallo-hydrolase [Desulfatiglans sp.]|jgi:glyoxylase-like metal-dependent hydrolase (beta-lactamase superfamily II)|nr:MBL fold metallo-hydrolase [Desulfatiglans sp.]